MNWSVVGLALAGYLCGSIPFGLILGRMVKGVDLRDFGSGNIGATNAGRVLGRKWGLVCLILDALKGLLPVAFLPAAVMGSDHPAPADLMVMTGVATIVGHMFPCWLRFRGGKGVATSLGVVAVLSPWGLSAAFLAFVATVAVSRIVALGSIVAAVCFGLFYLTPYSRHSTSMAVFSIAVPLLILVQHRSNMLRMWNGTEPRIGQRKPIAAATGNEPAAP